jgi:hypothetical protein
MVVQKHPPHDHHIARFDQRVRLPASRLRSPFPRVGSLEGDHQLAASTVRLCRNRADLHSTAANPSAQRSPPDSRQHKQAADAWRRRINARTRSERCGKHASQSHKSAQVRPLSVGIRSTRSRRHSRIGSTSDSRECHPTATPSSSASWRSLHSPLEIDSNSSHVMPAADAQRHSSWPSPRSSPP